MFLTDLSIKRPVVASVMSLVLVIFGLVTFQEIPTDELPDLQPPVVTIQTEYKGASAEIVDTQITQKIEDFVGGTPGLETIDSFSEDESSRITLTFETDLDLDDVANDVRSSVSRVLDNLPDGAEQPEIFKQSAGMRTTMWLSFNSETMSDLELTDYADRYLTDTFSTVDGVGRVRLGGQRELSLRVWLDPIALAARDLTTQEVESVLRLGDWLFAACCARLASLRFSQTLLSIAFLFLPSFCPSRHRFAWSNGSEHVTPRAMGPRARFLSGRFCPEIGVFGSCLCVLRGVSEGGGLS